jgi:glyoxylase-like metal-dependent hydrolase (beta-lactamase superfamily II)
MNKVHILVEGYARPGEGDAYLASPTTTLIETGDKKILVDPGTNGELLLKALNELGVSSNDISYIFLSHYHPDHFLNIKLFPDLDIYDGTLHWKNDEEYSIDGVLPGTDIEILPTPGHSPEHCSLLVKTEEGRVCIAQDVFWWEDRAQKSETEEDLLNLEDPYASDITALKVSRKLVLEKADYIIPGHGKKFKNPLR